MAMPSAERPGWTFMEDGVVFAMFNHQGSPRGGDEFVAPNWWMGMFAHDAGRGSFRVSTMFSLDPATVGADGYREILQVGEAYRGRPLVDRQHPHDFLMQLAGIYRTPVSTSTSVTVAGAVAGEPALGPVAFMHRASASELPLAPLSHHTFDSTHIAFGVFTAAIGRGPWTIETSVFNAREPDEHRWDVDFGRLDSASGRIWYKPNEEWSFQVSTGHLVDPEELEPGNIQRTTASASWTRVDARGLTAMTSGYGINATSHGRRQAVFVEGIRRRDPLAVFGRVEFVQVETNLLSEPPPPTLESRSLVAAFTAGAGRDVLRLNGFEGAVVGAVTAYRVPEVLRSAYGSHPLSVQVVFRVRLPSRGHGRMWNMTMTSPMMTSMHSHPGG
jgi:hypothetical protein